MPFDMESNRAGKWLCPCGKELKEPNSDIDLMAHGLVCANECNSPWREGCPAQVTIGLARSVMRRPR